MKVKKVISVLLAVLILISTFAISSFADDGFIYNGIKYSVENGELTVVGYTNDIPVKVNLPETVNGYKVTKIADRAMSKNTIIEAFFISRYVKEIGGFVFNGCSNLKAVDVCGNNQVFSSDESILYNKSKSTLIYCPENYFFPTGTYDVPFNTNIIGKNAFNSNKNIRKIVFPPSLVTIEDMAFSGLKNLIEADFTESFQLRKIGAWAFQLTGLTSLNLPDSVESIGDSAFASSQISTVTIGNNIKEMGSGVFFFTNYYMANMNNDPLYVGNYIVSANSGKKECTIKANTRLIADGCFQNHEKLSDVYFEGSAEDFSKIIIGKNNTPLLNATMHYGKESTGVYLSKTSVTLSLAETVVLVATVSGNDKVSSWSSSNASVATVDQNGKVTALSAGEAVITVKTSNGLSASCTVKVNKSDAKVESIKLDINEKTLDIGETFKLTATISPDNAADKTITWSSSDESVAIVDQNGNVTAIAEGSARIYAKSVNLKRDTCEITVVNKTKDTMEKIMTVLAKIGEFFLKAVEFMASLISTVINAVA